MPIPIHFVLNSHGFGFDHYSLLCIKSLLSVTSGFEVRVSVYCPTNLPPPSDLSLHFYKNYNVDIIYFENDFLPKRVDNIKNIPARHLTYNKIYTVQNIPEGQKRFFLDADIVFLKNPLHYLEKIEEPTGCSPVNTPEAFGGDWYELYRTLQIPFPKQTVEVWETYVPDNTPAPPKIHIPPSFSSGVFYATFDSKVPSIWLQTCKDLEQNLFLVPKTFFLDQIALSVAVQKSGESWHLIPRKFNTTYEIRRFTSDIHLFHYVGFDTLAAAIARFPEVRQQMQKVVTSLATEDGIDLRFQLLTQWPRWYRRGLGILSGFTEQLFKLPLVAKKERH